RSNRSGRFTPREGNRGRDGLTRRVVRRQRAGIRSAPGLKTVGFVVGTTPVVVTCNRGRVHAAGRRGQVRVPSRVASDKTTNRDGPPVVVGSPDANGPASSRVRRLNVTLGVSLSGGGGRRDGHAGRCRAVVADAKLRAKVVAEGVGRRRQRRRVDAWQACR